MYKTSKKRAVSGGYSTYKRKAAAAAYPLLKLPSANLVATFTLDKRLEHTTGGHNKFWEVKVIDNGPYHNTGYRFNVETRYGKMDTKGMSSVQDFTSQKACDIFVQKKIQEKLNKGYVEVGSATAPVVTAPVVPTKATLDAIKDDVKLAVNGLKMKMPAGVQYEAIITVIVGGEVIQETLKT